MIRLRVLGRVSVESSSAQIGPAAEQRKPLALLTLLAMARDTGLTREKLAAYLWPDASEENSRNTLKQTLYSLRRDLGCEDLFVSGAAQTLSVNPNRVSVDAWEFEDAIASGALEQAVSKYGGPFLDGFFLRGCAELEQWTERSRARLAARLAETLRTLAERAAAAGNATAALEWWKRLAELTPLDSTVALRLMEALAATGNRSAAIKHAEIHEALLRDELGAAVDPAVASLAERLRTSHRPSPTIEQRTVARDDTPQPTNAVAKSAPRRSGWRRAALLGMSVAVPIATVAFLLPNDTRIDARDELATTGELVAIAPFHLVAPDTSLAYLREGMVDLLGGKIGGIGPVRIASSATIAVPWMSLRTQEGREPSTDDAVAIARRSRAAKIIVGSLAVSGVHVSLDAVLMDVGKGTSIATTNAAGRIDELPTLVDRLSSQLLSLLYGGDRARVPMFGATPLSAVRAYAVGRSAFRAGDYHAALTAFRQATDLDSTFALAALGMCRAAAWVGDATARYRGYELAWKSRHRLSPGDEALLVAIVGPRFPDASSIRERALAWERVTRLDPDQPDAWFELGDLLFHGADFIGDEAARARIPLAFDAALRRDSSYGPALEHIVQYAARLGDTALVRTYAARALAVASAADVDFLRWRVGLSLPDRASETQRLRQRFDSLDLSSLRSIALTAMSDQATIDDAERAMTIAARRSLQSGDAVDALIGLHAVLMMRGRRSMSSAALDRLASTTLGEESARSLRVLDAIFTGADSSAARRSAEALSRTDDKTPSRNAVSSHCVAAQWWVATGDGSRANADVDAIRKLRHHTTDDIAKRGIDGEARTCLALLDAWRQVVTKSPDALRALSRTDSLVAQGPDVGTRLEAELPLVLASLWEKVGRPAEALRAIRRVGYFYRWPHYRAEELAVEARLAAATGDTSGAIDAYRRFLALRDAPDAGLSKAVRDAREQLDKLTAARR